MAHAQRGACEPAPSPLKGTMNHRIRLSEAAFAPLEVYVLDVAHLEGPDEDEAATCREIADAVVRLPNGGAVLHLPDADDEARLWRWYAVVAAGAESAHESGHHSWERSLAATASKVLDPLRERERMRENKADQRFIRRAPVATRTGQAKRERRFRYTYDADEATRTTLPARVGEKLRIPHKGTIGHYEVVERLAPDVVGVRHDETNHAMVISDVGLRKLARDVYRPGDGTKPASQEDVRHRHEREDALPKSRYETLKAIEDASGIEDHDFSIADAAYHAWKTAGAKQPKAKIEGKPKKGAKKGAKKTRGPRVKRPPKPPPWEGGQLDAFEADLRRDARGRVRHFSSLLEAFEHATRGARTWRDIEPALAMLRDTPGFQEARFPDDVYERHAQHDIELADQGHTIDVEQYGVTLPPNPTAADVSEAVLFAMPAGELSEEDEARAARESESEDEEGLGDLWA